MFTFALYAIFSSTFPKSVGKKQFQGHLEQQKDEFPQSRRVPTEVERPPQQLLHYHAGLVRHRDADGRHPRLRRGGLRDPQVNALRLLHVLPANLDEASGQAAHRLPERREPSPLGDALAVHVQR